MTNTILLNKINELNELEALLCEAKAEADAIKDSIKEYMDYLGTEELICSQYIVRNTSVLTSKFDTKRFKKDYEEVYKLFLKQVSSKRFSISC